MEANRDKWLGTLEIIGIRRPDEAEAEWAWVMKELGLGPEYFLGIYEAIQQGRWREAENPGAYLKTAARREAKRLRPDGEKRPRGVMAQMRGLEPEEAEIPLGRSRRSTMDGDSIDSSEDGGGRTADDALDNLEYRQDSGKPIKRQDGTWRSSAGRGTDHEGLLRPTGGKPRRGSGKKIAQGNGSLLRLYEKSLRRLGRGEPREAYVKEPGVEHIENWEKWAREAGLSEWEKRVVEYRMSGIEREEALRLQPDAQSVRALRAAWRKVERTGLERLSRTRPTSEENE